MNLTPPLLPAVFTTLGAHLPAGTPIRIYLIGGAAGMLGRLLAPERVTTDCDAVEILPPTSEEALVQAVKATAQAHGLPPTWLNSKAKRFAYQLPLGWKARATHWRTFGPLEVFLIGRQDLIASKAMSAANARPHDLEDLQHLRPTAEEVAFTLTHIDRVEAEDGDRNEYDAERAIIRSFLKG